VLLFFATRLHRLLATFAPFNYNNNRMKAWVTIVCFYILLISATPCCRDNNHADDDTCRTELPQTDCSGLCSPFCLCNTCEGLTIILAFDDIQLSQAADSPEHTAYTLPIYCSPSPEGLRQPPQS
jgi:hypothetical protein